MQKDIESLRAKCKQIRLDQGISLATIVNETDVSKSTVEAFYGNTTNRQFRYETVKPLIKHMMQYDIPAEEVDVPIPNPDMIEMYRTIIDIKNRSIEYLKEQQTEMRRSRNLFRTLFIIMSFVMIALFLIDASLYGRGWLNNPVQYSPVPSISVTETPKP